MEEQDRLRQRLKDMSKYRSYDFSLKDTELEREERKQCARKGAVRQRWRWLLVVCIGVVVACLSMLLNLAIAGLNLAKIHATERVISSTGGFWGPYFVYVGISAAYALLAGAVVAFWAPKAAGSGMSEIKAYFNGVHMTGLLSLRTLVGKLVSAVFVLSAGLIAEGEAPFVHLGAIVGGGMSSTGSQSLTRMLCGSWEAKLPRKWAGHFRNEYDHRDFTAIGAAAGIAVAFAAPVSGMVFIAEESAANLGPPIYYRALVGDCAALLVLNILAAAYNDGARFWNTRLFNQLTPGTAGVLGLLSARLWDLPVIVAFSCCLGCLGALFVILNTRIVAAARHHFIPPSSRYRRTLEVAALAVVTGTIWLGISYGSPCAPLPSPQEQAALLPQPLPSNLILFASYQQFPRLWCAPGQYSVFGKVFLRPPRLMLRYLVGLNADSARGLPDLLLSTPVVALYAGVTYAMLLITYGASASLGVITPVLQFGAACGLLLGHGMRAAAAALGDAPAVSLQLYTAVGAAAFLAGSVRYKAAAVLITVEALGAWALTVPITIAVFCAKAVADQLSSGLFEAYLAQACVPVIREPLTSSRVAAVTNALTVRDVMATGVTALPPLAPARRLVDALKRCPYAAFPVTEEVQQAATPGAEFHVLGIIERNALLRMLQHRIGLCAQRGDGIDDGGGGYRLPSSRERRQELLETFEQRPLKSSSPDAEAAILRSALEGCEDGCYDLRPFMFRAPLLVQEGASLTRAMSLFRQMGLHHILVAPSDPRAIGFITRKDLVMENAQLKFLELEQQRSEGDVELPVRAVK